MKRQIKFAFLFTGLAAATVLTLWLAVRFVLLLWPGAEESVTLAAQPAAVAVQVTVGPSPAAVSASSSSLAAAALPPASAPTAPPARPDTAVPALPDSPITQSPDYPITQSPDYQLPPQLIIPSLNVNRIVKTVPVVAGQWDISQIESDFGWLQTTGEYPGDDWGMTIVGHVTRPWPEIAGPLAELAFMKPGDEIIYRQDGTDYVYALERFLKVDPESVESLYVPDGEVLSLATCAAWNYVSFNYDKRLIARARLVRAEPSPATADQLE